MISKLKGIHITALCLALVSLKVHAQSPDKDSFFRAMQNLDFKDDHVVQAIGEKREYALAMKSFIDGDYLQTKYLLVDLLVNAKDSTIRQYSQEVLQNLLVLDGDWRNYTELIAEGIIKKDSANTDVLALTAFRYAPHERYEYRKDDFILKVKAKQSGTQFIPTLINGKKVYSIFDTGAGINVISKSLAKKIHAHELTNGPAYTQSASDKHIAFIPGYIDSVQIGSLMVYNVPVGIMDDKALEFKILGIRMFHIDAIVGWPMIMNMRVELNYKTETMRIMNPLKQAKTAQRNLFWYGIPMVKLKEAGNNTDMIFEIDLGAYTTDLYDNFLNKTKDTSLCFRKKLKIGSAGGFTTYQSFICKDVQLMLAGRKLYFKKAKARPDIKIRNAIIADGVLGGDVGEDKILRIDFQNGVFDILDAEQSSAQNRID